MEGGSIFKRCSDGHQVYMLVIYINNEALKYNVYYFENQKAGSLFKDVASRCGWGINKIRIYWKKEK
jgi:hypothetical protein